MPEPRKKEREERQIRILGNLFGCLMCLIGLIYFFEEGARGVIASIVPFYCALLAIPRTGRIINKFTEQKYKFSISGKSKLIVCILLFAITVKIHPSPDSSTKTNQPPEATKQGRTTEFTFIDGLMPVDVYLNMEKRGFRTEKNFMGSEYGNVWTNKKEELGIEYEVTTFSHNAHGVENVRATAWVDMVNKRIEAAIPFFKFAASFPYEKSEPEKAQKWVEGNFNKNGATTAIGGVRFTMHAPSEMVRILLIEPIQAGVVDRNFTKSNVTWALHDSPLLVAVEIDDYNGDILESGDYKAELRDYQANTAETFDVIVAQKELASSDCFSILRDAYSESYKSSIDSETYSHYAMGGMSGSSEIISLKKGEYIHIIPGTYYLNKIGSPQENKTSGVFYLSKIVQKF
jgi:hypothetical protein